MLACRQIDKILKQGDLSLSPKRSMVRWHAVPVHRTVIVEFSTAHRTH